MSRSWAARDKEGLVRLDLSPLLWLTAGALALAFQAYTGIDVLFDSGAGRTPQGPSAGTVSR